MESRLRSKASAPDCAPSRRAAPGAISQGVCIARARALSPSLSHTARRIIPQRVHDHPREASLQIMMMSAARAQQHRHPLRPCATSSLCVAEAWLRALLQVLVLVGQRHGGRVRQLRAKPSTRTRTRTRESRAVSGRRLGGGGRAPDAVAAGGRRVRAGGVAYLEFVLCDGVGVDGDLWRFERGRLDEGEVRVADELAREPEEGLLEVVVGLGRDVVVLEVLLAVEGDLCSNEREHKQRETRRAAAAGRREARRACAVGPVVAVAHASP